MPTSKSCCEDGVNIHVKHLLRLCSHYYPINYSEKPQKLEVMPIWILRWNHLGKTVIKYIFKCSLLLCLKESQLLLQVTWKKSKYKMLNNMAEKETLFGLVNS